MIARLLIASLVAAAAFLAPVSASRALDQRKLLESKESLYNNIYVYGQGPYVSMTFGYNRNIYTESIYNTLDDRDLPVEYTRAMTASLIYAKNLHSILEIGFGGGRTSWYLHRFLPDVAVTSVELDPTVLELAHKYFGIKEEPNFHVANRDGRIFLADSKERYDIILIDAYRGPFVPFHLLTKEFYEIVKSHLADGGVVAQNVEPTDHAVRFGGEDHQRGLSADRVLSGRAAISSPSPMTGRRAPPPSSTAWRANATPTYHFRYPLHDMLATRQRGGVDDAGFIDPQRQGPDRRFRAGRSRSRRSSGTTGNGRERAPARIAASRRSIVEAFVVGGVLMGFEMLGSRYLFPYFGGGIGTWAGLISMVLCALAIGYFTGGGDRRAPSVAAHHRRRHPRCRDLSRRRCRRPPTR